MLSGSSWTAAQGQSPFKILLGRLNILQIVALVVGVCCWIPVFGKSTKGECTVVLLEWPEKIWTFEVERLCCTESYLLASVFLFSFCNCSIFKFMSIIAHLLSKFLDTNPSRSSRSVFLIAEPFCAMGRVLLVRLHQEFSNLLSDLHSYIFSKTWHLSVQQFLVNNQSWWRVSYRLPYLFLWS